MMNRRFMLLVLALSAVFLTAADDALAADTPPTTITVEGMHCVVCASKVASNLQSVAGVHKAQVDAEKAVAVVTAKSSAAPSPRALWEAIEQAGYKPIKLVGPTGTFTAKPKS